VEARTTRLVQVVLALVLVAVVVWALTLDGGNPAPALPDPIEAISPADGSQVPRQQPVTIDMAIGYEVTLSVQDRASGEFVEVDPARTSFEPATGVLVWTPPEDATPTGTFRLRVDYRSTVGLADIGSYEWTIRTY
jgi:hypothetical protein